MAKALVIVPSTRSETAAAALPCDEFAWVPEWLSNPPPPTPAAERAAEILSELHAKKSS